mmetsp:Transcript_15530/g.28159  ORF Transcript_15530/g.28159 Transcript_15530/m.28159 type:complete len:88 (-) Transcript_15530:144-407(-)
MDHKKLFKLKFMARIDEVSPAALQTEQWSLEANYKLPEFKPKESLQAGIAASRMSFGHFNPSFESKQKKRKRDSESQPKKHRKTDCN